ncbi:TPA: [citrate (pro-3S)-lyase] ligase [Salmonella enterica]|nr:[citrate (pro-3S)-lyase] ligase [Salmonella enterica]
MNIIFKQCIPQRDAWNRARLVEFLSESGLTLEADCEVMVLAEQRGRLVGCGAIAGNVIKDIAIDPTARGDGLSLKLLTELLILACEMGRNDLFLFTKPQNVVLFSGAGFFPIAQTEHVVLMENSRERLARYCRQLALYRQPGDKIGAIVMNANPFTLGHRYLVEQALKQCDWLHIFVVQEDASFFSYLDRCKLIEQGILGMDRVTLHPGSSYIISRATFPGYFLKDKGVVDESHSQIDLQLFRDHLAPALGITHRFVGTEPNCQLTRAYNQKMKTLLAPTIEVVELPRTEKEGAAISASRVRKLYNERNWQALAPLVPSSTLAFLTRLAAGNTETA